MSSGCTASRTKSQVWNQSKHDHGKAILHVPAYDGLRERLAKLLKFHYYGEIERLFSGDKDLCDRLRNLAVRNYRLTLREEDETMDGME